MKLRRLTAWFCIVALLFLLSGCTERPFLTKDGVYSFVTVAEDGNFQKTPIHLTWNSNYAVMQQLLLEASFVLGDLHSLSEPPQSDADILNKVNQELEKDHSKLTHPLETPNLIDLNKSKGKVELQGTIFNEQSGLHEKSSTEKKPLSNETKTIFLEAAFPEAKSFELMIDDKSTQLDISSIQIEVIGDYPCRVILNQTLFLQGIENPNLEPAFAQFMEMLSKT